MRIATGIPTGSTTTITMTTADAADEVVGAEEKAEMLPAAGSILID